jgi:DNA-binding beta-propeller fold protein YncE
MEPISNVVRPLLLASLLSGVSALAMAQEALPDGQVITPTAAPGAVFNSLNPGLADSRISLQGKLVTTAVSPDGTTLLVLTSGYNLLRDSDGHQIPQDSNEYVFVLDITSGSPVQSQVIQVPNTYSGIAFSPDGTQFYVPGGKDDSIHTYAKTGSNWAETGTPVVLGHSSGNGLAPGLTLPAAAGLAVTADGKTMVVANYENDSVSLVNVMTREVSAELDLRPGKNDPLKAGVPGGEFPYWVTIKGNDTAYISSVRDREIVVVNFKRRAPRSQDEFP